MNFSRWCRCDEQPRCMLHRPAVVNLCLRKSDISCHQGLKTPLMTPFIKLGVLQMILIYLAKHQIRILIFDHIYYKFNVFRIFAKRNPLKWVHFVSWVLLTVYCIFYMCSETAIWQIEMKWLLFVASEPHRWFECPWWFCLSWIKKKATLPFVPVTSWTVEGTVLVTMSMYVRTSLFVTQRDPSFRISLVQFSR